MSGTPWKLKTRTLRNELHSGRVQQKVLCFCYLRNWLPSQSDLTLGTNWAVPATMLARRVPGGRFCVLGQSGGLRPLRHKREAVCGRSGRPHRTWATCLPATVPAGCHMPGTPLANQATAAHLRGAEPDTDRPEAVWAPTTCHKLLPSEIPRGRDSPARRAPRTAKPNSKDQLPRGEARVDR